MNVMEKAREQARASEGWTKDGISFHRPGAERPEDYEGAERAELERKGFEWGQFLIRVDCDGKTRAPKEARGAEAGALAERAKAFLEKAGETEREIRERYEKTERGIPKDELDKLGLFDTHPKLEEIENEEAGARQRHRNEWKDILAEARELGCEGRISLLKVLPAVKKALESGNWERREETAAIEGDFVLVRNEGGRLSAGEAPDVLRIRTVRHVRHPGNGLISAVYADSCHRKEFPEGIVPDIKESDENLVSITARNLDDFKGLDCPTEEGTAILYRNHGRALRCAMQSSETFAMEMGPVLVRTDASTCWAVLDDCPDFRAKSAFGHQAWEQPWFWRDKFAVRAMLYSGNEALFALMEKSRTTASWTPYHDFDHYEDPDDYFDPADIYERRSYDYDDELDEELLNNID